MVKSKWMQLPNVYESHMALGLDETSLMGKIDFIDQLNTSNVGKYKFSWKII